MIDKPALLTIGIILGLFLSVVVWYLVTPKTKRPRFKYPFRFIVDFEPAQVTEEDEPIKEMNQNPRYAIVKEDGKYYDPNTDKQIHSEEELT